MPSTLIACFALVVDATLRIVKHLSTQVIRECPAGTGKDCASLVNAYASQASGKPFLEAQNYANLVNFSALRQLCVSSASALRQLSKFHINTVITALPKSCYTQPTP
jgi:hypothetical protein